jgi:hypothetical protein
MVRWTERVFMVSRSLHMSVSIVYVILGYVCISLLVSSGSYLFKLLSLPRMPVLNLMAVEMLVLVIFEHQQS